MSKPAAGGRHAVTRLICTSLSRVKGSVMDQLFDIRDELEQHPDPRLVHAALLHASGWFVLWLEGPAADVEFERQRAAGDPRNSNQLVIHRSVGPALLDEAFVAGVTQGPDTPSAFARRIYRIRDGHQAGERLAPEQVWKQLQSPCTAMQAAGTASQPHRLVALVAADDTPSVETLRRLAERFASPVVYQRFAGPERRTSDVGAAYIDIAKDGQVHRVRLLARRALGRPMLRRCLQGADDLVVLVGERPSAAISLVATIALAVRTLPANVVIHLVARTPAIALGFAQMLRDAVGAVLVHRIVAQPESRLDEAVLGLANADADAEARALEAA